jgi:multiple sugar transport system permease protein
VVTIFPFFVMAVLSLQKGRALSLPGSLFPTHINFGAYRDAFASGDMPRWLVNTAIYSVTSVVLVLLLASIAAYAFAKKRFYGRTVLFWGCLAMLMVPYHLTLIPQFILVRNLGLLNTLPGLIVPTLANAQALFLMRQFIRAIPDELIEAARIDGAGELRVLMRIVLPQCKPIIATLGVFVFLWHWNDFLWPLVAMQSPDHYTLTVGLASLQAQQTSLAVTMAAAVITFLPILVIYLALQRYFVRGVTMTGLK